MTATNVNRHDIPRQAAIVDIYDRVGDPFGRLSIVHPAHPMRKAQTIKVSSLKEMVRPIYVATTINDLLSADYAIAYSINPDPINKPELNVYLDSGYGFIFRIASTLDVPEDSKRAAGVEDAMKGLLLKRLDAIEAMIWFYVFLDKAFWPPFVSLPTTYREIFALSRALLSRLMPSDTFDVMLSPKSYGAALLENAAGSANNANYTEPQVAAGQLTLVPIAFNGFIYATSDVLCVYPSSLPALCKRYIYEIFMTERVADGATDSNLYRMTAERYLLISVPTDYYNSMRGWYVAPIVATWADDALESIRSSFGTGVYSNLELVSTIS